jgi:uncharacterized protein with HEPN domain
MSKRTPRLLLEDILDAAQKIKQYVGVMTYEEFLSDSKTFDAILRNLEIMGEASNLLPKEVRLRYQHIEWDRIVGLRNRLIHGYFGVDPSIVWHIIQEDLPPIITAIDRILNES